MNSGDIDKDLKSLACPPWPTPLNFLPIYIIHEFLVDKKLDGTGLCHPPILPLQNLGEWVIQKIYILWENIPKFITFLLEVIKDLVDMLQKEIIKKLSEIRLQRLSYSRQDYD